MKESAVSAERNEASSVKVKSDAAWAAVLAIVRAARAAHRRALVDVFILGIDIGTGRMYVAKPAPNDAVLSPIKFFHRNKFRAYND